jgi:hypothetical protein
MAVSVAMPFAAVLACSASRAPAPGTADSPSPTSMPMTGDTTGLGDASALLAEIAAYADATPLAAPDARAKPKFYKPAVDPAANSPNGNCMAASAPAPDFHAAAMNAAQATLICYEYALKRSAPSPAHLEIMLDVNEDGRLRDAAVLFDDFADEKMRTCTVRKLRETERFPSPKTGCGSVTRLPLTFLRADGGF